MIRSLILSSALACALLAGCKKTPPDCKKVEEFFCKGEMKGTDDECALARRAAGTKNAKQCAQAFVNLKNARVDREKNQRQAEKDKAFRTELAAREDIQAEMEKIAAPAFELNDRKAELEGKKKLTAAEKKELEEVLAKIADIDRQLNELNMQLARRAGIQIPPDGGPVAPAPGGGTK